jgi:hypothetical protein
LFQELSAIVIVIIEGRGDFIPVAPRPPTASCRPHHCLQALSSSGAVVLLALMNCFRNCQRSSSSSLKVVVISSLLHFLHRELSSSSVAAVRSHHPQSLSATAASLPSAAIVITKNK